MKSKMKQQVSRLDFTDCGGRSGSTWILAGSGTPDRPERSGSTRANTTSAGCTETNQRDTRRHVSMATAPATSTERSRTRMVILRLLRRPHRPGSRAEAVCLGGLEACGARGASTCPTANVPSDQQRPSVPAQLTLRAPPPPAPT